MRGGVVFAAAAVLTANIRNVFAAGNFDALNKVLEDLVLQIDLSSVEPVSANPYTIDIGDTGTCTGFQIADIYTDGSFENAKEYHLRAGVTGVVFECTVPATATNSDGKKQTGQFSILSKGNGVSFEPVLQILSNNFKEKGVESAALLPSVKCEDMIDLSSIELDGEKVFVFLGFIDITSIALGAMQDPVINQLETELCSAAHDIAAALSEQLVNNPFNTAKAPEEPPIEPLVIAAEEMISAGECVSLLETTALAEAAHELSDTLSIWAVQAQTLANQVSNLTIEDFQSLLASGGPLTVPGFGNITWTPVVLTIAELKVIPVADLLVRIKITPPTWFDLSSITVGYLFELKNSFDGFKNLDLAKLWNDFYKVVNWSALPGLEGTLIGDLIETIASAGPNFGNLTSSINVTTSIDNLIVSLKVSVLADFSPPGQNHSLADSLIDVLLSVRNGQATGWLAELPLFDLKGFPSDPVDWFTFAEDLYNDFKANATATKQAIEDSIFVAIEEFTGIDIKPFLQGSSGSSGLDLMDLLQLFGFSELVIPLGSGGSLGINSLEFSGSFSPNLSSLLNFSLAGEHSVILPFLDFGDFTGSLAVGFNLTIEVPVMSSNIPITVADTLSIGLSWKDFTAQSALVVGIHRVVSDIVVDLVSNQQAPPENVLGMVLNGTQIDVTAALIGLSSFNINMAGSTNGIINLASSSLSALLDVYDSILTKAFRSVSANGLMALKLSPSLDCPTSTPTVEPTYAPTSAPTGSPVTKDGATDAAQNDGEPSSSSIGVVVGASVGGFVLLSIVALLILKPALVKGVFGVSSAGGAMTSANQTTIPTAKTIEDTI